MPDALNELIPDWKEKDAPLKTKVTKDKMLILTEKRSIEIPQLFTPSALKNHGNYLISLSQLAAWLGT